MLVADVRLGHKTSTLKLTGTSPPNQARELMAAKLKSAVEGSWEDPVELMELFAFVEPSKIMMIGTCQAGVERRCFGT